MVRRRWSRLAVGYGHRCGSERTATLSVCGDIRGARTACVCHCIEHDDLQRSLTLSICMFKVCCQLGCTDSISLPPRSWASPYIPIQLLVQSHTAPPLTHSIRYQRTSPCTCRSSHRLLTVLLQRSGSHVASSSSPHSCTSSVEHTQTLASVHHSVAATHTLAEGKQLGSLHAC